MLKDYIIQDNLNFFKMIGEVDNTEDDETENKCQISGQPLREDAVRLKCQHIFNYDALFNDIYEHKRRGNFNEINHVGVKSIRCPYCRQIQHNVLLPSHPSKPHVFGVNYYCEELDYSFLNKNIIEIPKCDYVGKTGKPCMVRLGKKVNNDYLCQNHLMKIRRAKLLEMDKKYQSHLKEQNDELKRNFLLLNTTLCVEILKRGPRKGEKCNNRTKPSFSCCDKHKPK
jgi:hypothetical protein